MPIRKVGSETPTSDAASRREPRIAPQRRVHAHRDAHHDGDQAGRQRQFERGRQPLLDQRADRATLAQADAEVTLHRVADEGGELQEEGLVQPQVGTQPRAILGCRVLPEHLRHGVADVLEQQEGDEGHGQHDEDGLQQTADDEREHLGARAAKTRPVRPGRHGREIYLRAP